MDLNDWLTSPKLLHNICQCFWTKSFVLHTNNNLFLTSKSVNCKGNSILWEQDMFAEIVANCPMPSTFFHHYIIFSLFTKFLCRPEEMASRAGFGTLPGVWRPLL